MSPAQILAPSLEDIERLARGALTTIPEPLRKLTRDVVVRVEEFPDEATEHEMELETPFDLLGLYRGVGIEGRDNPRTGTEPDMVFLYRRPLLDYWCETGEELGHLVRHVMIHEIGHHFGFSDDDMEALEVEKE
jgi:predicted Zn-dependent protease with MMP-like domain